MAVIINEEWWQGVIHNTNKVLSFACLLLIQFTVYMVFIILHQDFDIYPDIEVRLFPVHNCIILDWLFNIIHL